MSKKYIHYGHSSFDRNLFESIQNCEIFVKPLGGLWASPVDTEYGWKNWCEGNSFHTSRLKRGFEFTLKENVKVLHIRSVNDLTDLPKQEDSGSLASKMWVCLDFEKLLSDGWDAVELHLSEEDLSQVSFLEGLYWTLYGWDCDSILVMNPDVVEAV